MPRFTLACCAAFFVLLITSQGRSDDNALDPFAMAEDPRVPKLISQLSNADPTIRNGAVERLINLRSAAWPALRRKLDTASPQVRAEIDRVLLHISWVQPDDNAMVTEAFTEYASLDAESRCQRIEQFWLDPNAPQPTPPSALLRIVLNDPSTAVRWQAANVMRNALKDDQALSRQVVDLVDGTKLEANVYVTPNRNAPLVAIAGMANSKRNPARCAELLDKALTMEEDRPTEFRGQMDFVFMWLIDRATLLRQHQRAIQLLREQAARTRWIDGYIPDAVTDLFAAQADFGPDAGFADDLRVYQEYFTHPEMVYTLARLASRKQHPALAQLLECTAMLICGSDSEAHFMAGRFLAMHRWNRAAERELKCCLALSYPEVVNVYFELSRVADERTDDLASAKYEETALKKLTNTAGMYRVNRFGDRTAWTPDSAWAEIHWHYLRYAQQNNDMPGIRENLDKLLGDDEGAKTLEESPSMAADIVPALQQVGKKELADSIFEKAFNSLQKDVTEAPDEPLPKNNLAWLCCCSNKRLEEAAQLVAKAIELAPDDGACWDTQADILMRLGQPGKAVESELKAMELKPDDVYMSKQLARFRAAAAKQSR